LPSRESHISKFKGHSFVATQSTVEAAGQQGSTAQQMLTFELGGETYGVDILRVREIRGWTSVTRIPQAPPHVLGVLNMRGSIVPVVDLRMRFDLERAEYTKVTVIIVLSVQSTAGRREVGVVVDAVSDVVDVKLAEMKPAPDLGSQFATDYIQGLFPVGQRMVVLLDIDRLIGARVARLDDRTDGSLDAAAA
jgi:purine-binding chemotaxis protein CheW